MDIIMTDVNVYNDISFIWCLSIQDMLNIQNSVDA